MGEQLKSGTLKRCYNSELVTSSSSKIKIEMNQDRLKKLKISEATSSKSLIDCNNAQVNVDQQTVFNVQELERLLNEIELQLKESDDKIKFNRSIELLDWKQIAAALGDYSSDICKSQWMFLQSRVLNHKTLEGE